MVDVRPHRKLHNQMSLQKKTNMKVDCRSELVSCTVLSFALKDLFHKKFNKHSFCCHTTTSSSSFSTVHSSGETSLILAVSSHFSVRHKFAPSVWQCFPVSSLSMACGFLLNIALLFILHRRRHSNLIQSVTFSICLNTHYTKGSFWADNLSSSREKSSKLWDRYVSLSFK